MAAVAALIPLLTAWYPQIPWEALVAAAAALVGAGELAQRHEDGKTVAALHETSPQDRAAALQVELTKLEADQTT
ncbi:hypothetical protein [Kitasatospora sp. MAA19]|uniref:hypothetical protein n=1 Tax=Kitasatospora sp. MAA19 TaxID=3035090 RepID=UPI0024742922|nr:hypothetical protein [Kitasatospora sp. MAA19]